MSLKNIIKSDSYDDYWLFSHRRQDRFLCRLNDKQPQDEDSILDVYKFTNCYRALDRVTQHLIKEITNNSTFSPEDTFLRVIIYKLFNKIETWKALEEHFGEISLATFNVEKYAQALETRRSSGQKIYSAAYIMPSGSREYGSPTKHVNNLLMVEHMLKKELHRRVWQAKQLQEIYTLLHEIPSIGRFLAFQYSVDLCYSSYSGCDESQFVVAGPGAVRGIHKCFHNVRPDQYEEIIKYVTDLQSEEFERLNLTFTPLKNRNLQLIDCQNLFCETDKYLRVKSPHLDRKPSRIKQKFKPNLTNIEFTLPSKWKAEIPDENLHI